MKQAGDGTAMRASSGTKVCARRYAGREAHKQIRKPSLACRTALHSMRPHNERDTTMTTRRHFSAAMAAAAMLLPFTAALADEPVKVRFGVDSHIFSSQFWVAKEKGYFERRGIKPELSVYSFGIDTLNAALLDQVDFAEGYDFAILSRLSGGDLRIVSYIQHITAEANKVVVRDGIKSPADLAGKKFGVQKATQNEYVADKYLKRFGLEGKVTPVGFTSNPEIFAALDRGDIQAAIFNSTFLEKALQIKGVSVINTQADIPHAGKGFAVVTGKFHKANPQVTAKVLAALDEATKFILANPKDAADIVFKTVKIPKETFLKDVADKHVVLDIHFHQDEYQQLQDIADYSVKAKLIRGGFKLEDHILLEPLRSALPQKVTVSAGAAK
jgi:NitT/TauT family transport system substrate-binding protein